MLILIGTVPTAYALNKAVTPAETQTFVAVANRQPRRSGSTRTALHRPRTRVPTSSFTSSIAN